MFVAAATELTLTGFVGARVASTGQIPLEVMHKGECSFMGTHFST